MMPMAQEVYYRDILIIIEPGERWQEEEEALGKVSANGSDESMAPIGSRQAAGDCSGALLFCMPNRNNCILFIAVACVIAWVRGLQRGSRGHGGLAHPPSAVLNGGEQAGASILACGDRLAASAPNLLSEIQDQTKSWANEGLIRVVLMLSDGRALQQLKGAGCWDWIRASPSSSGLRWGAFPLCRGGTIWLPQSPFCAPWGQNKWGAKSTLDPLVVVDCRRVRCAVHGL
jgi:hypothetical protein